ncbi:MAG TPA: hypothetical protein VHC96_11680 [Puia sp.]|nr:hypothetical protein [Puia sp.]
MILLSTIRLVKSLSASEKRYFKLASSIQTGDKDYITLFDVIDKSPSGDEKHIKKRFAAASDASLNHSARYLEKVLTDCLIQLKLEKDTFFGMLQEIMRSRILKERSLEKEGNDHLKKVRQLASHAQQHWIEYFTYRDELNFLSDTDFAGINDKDLVGTQMRAREILRDLNSIQNHYSLYELLKYRIVHSAKIFSEENKKQLYDLMLSEMALVAEKSKSSFASQKLHLLFQSFFFIEIADYRSALTTFHSLNRLFEQNLSLLDHPPLDYFSALSGIIDSLHTLRQYEEMNFYLGKIAELDKSAYPEYFRHLIKKTICIFRIAILTDAGDFEAAREFVRSLDPDMLHLYSFINEEKSWEIYFYCSLAYFGNKDLKKAHYYIGKAMQLYKSSPQLFIYRAIRLLNIMVYYENEDTDYLDYEIRSYKRLFRKGNALLGIESLLIKFITTQPNKIRKRLPDNEHRQFLRRIDSISQDKYERQLLKYFDFAGWLRKKITP